MVSLQVTPEVRARVIDAALANRKPFLKLTESQRERIVAMAERRNRLRSTCAHCGAPIR